MGAGKGLPNQTMSMLRMYARCCRCHFDVCQARCPYPDQELIAQAQEMCRVIEGKGAP